MKKVLTVILSLLVVIGAFVIAAEVPTQAATVKLNKKSVKLEVGKTKKIKVKGTKETVTWSTSDKKVATVSKKGKITAKGAGECTITAKVGSKTLTCKVTVTAPASSSSFGSTVKVGEITFPFDNSWLEYPVGDPGNGIYAKMYYAGTNLVIYESVAVPSADYNQAISSDANFKAVAQIFADELSNQAGVSNVKLNVAKENGVYYAKSTAVGDVAGVTVPFAFYLKLQDNNCIITMVMSMDGSDTLSAETEALAYELCKAAKK